MGLLGTLSEGPKREGEELLKDQEGRGARRLPISSPFAQTERRQKGVGPACPEQCGVPPTCSHSGRLLFPPSELVCLVASFLGG